MGEAILVGGRMGAVEQVIYKWKQYQAVGTNTYYWNRYNVVSTTIYKWNKWNAVATMYYKWGKYKLDNPNTINISNYSSISPSIISSNPYMSFWNAVTLDTTRNIWLLSNRSSYTPSSNDWYGVVGLYINKWPHDTSTMTGADYDTKVYADMVKSYTFSQHVVKVNSYSVSGGYNVTEYNVSGGYISLGEVKSTNSEAYIPNSKKLLGDKYISKLYNSDGYLYQYNYTEVGYSKGSTSYGQVSSTSSSAYPSNGASGSYWYESAGSTTTYHKGSTQYSDVSSTNSSAYPDNNYSGSYWYVYSRYTTTWSQGEYIGDKLSTDRDRYPDNGRDGDYWYVFDGES